MSALAPAVERFIKGNEGGCRLDCYDDATGRLLLPGHTIIGTAHLLGVNVLHYLQDRCSGACRLPALADLIRQRTAAPAAALLAAA